jgi:large subunit ribosomal protein L9
MRILLDETETSLKAQTVGDALRQAADLVGQRGRLIVEVEVDGIRWSEEDLATPETSERAAGELKLLTAHPAELLRETFTQASEAIVAVEEIQCEAAKRMQAGRTKEGLQALLEALAVWGAVQTGLSRGLNLGVLGDVVRVKDGYARNYLIPTGKARRATDAAIKEFEARRADLEKAQAERLAQARALGERLQGSTARIAQKAGVDGRLFGSVTNFDIAEELAKQGYKVAKAQVRMPNGPIKAVCDSSVSVALHTDVVVDITVTVLGETA